MTELMKQLQQWANRGAFKFPSGDDKGGFTMRKEDSYNPDIGAWELTPEQSFGIQCVLDGTIQVWRPVEYYPPRDSTKVLGFNSKLKKALPCYVEQRYFNDVNGCIYPLYNGVYTHWQHLPPPPLKGN